MNEEKTENEKKARFIMDSFRSPFELVRGHFICLDRKFSCFWFWWIWEMSLGNVYYFTNSRGVGRSLISSKSFLVLFCFLFRNSPKWCNLRTKSKLTRRQHWNHDNELQTYDSLIHNRFDLHWTANPQGKPWISPELVKQRAPREDDLY